MEQSLFDKYGGVKIVTKIVKYFHEELMLRPNLRRYFENLPTSKIVAHHIEYVSYALGKPDANYTAEEYHNHHLNVGITKASYDLVIDLLLDVLEDEGVTDEDMDIVYKKLNLLRNEIVTKGIEK
tara:strand:- start:422 stop:796 length:375 start_codon:yes stop_codon:yes gene_type:complete